MKRKINIILFLILLFVFNNHNLFAQQLKPLEIKKTDLISKLTALGVIAPDGKTTIFPMSLTTSQKFEKELGVVRIEGGIPFVRTSSWDNFYHVAKASVNDLERTVADLLARVDKLEKRVDELEGRVK